MLATELRIWGSREVRGGNAFLRKVQRGARWCTNVHSVILLLWLVSVGAANVGDSLAHPGGALDQYLRGNGAGAGAGAGRGMFGNRGGGGGGGRRAWHQTKAAKWAKVFVVRPLGWLLRVAVPSTGAVMRVAEPVQGVITWVERYPQYRVM